MVISAPVSSWILVDHLALGADDLADLVDGIFTVMIRGA
jgi:hypothetical protein